MKTGLQTKRQSARAASHRPASRTDVLMTDDALQRRIDASAAMQRQRAQLERTFGHSLQRVAEEEEELMQGKFATQFQADLEEEELQGKFDGPPQRQGLEEEELLQGRFAEPLQRAAEAAPNRTGMPDKLKRGIESLSGMDMSDLRVHYNSPKPAQLNAQAYAQGSNIHLAPGQERHLPHEAWHTVQQRQGRVTPTMTLNGEKINDDAGLEKEADVMGDKASRYE